MNKAPSSRLLDILRKQEKVLQVYEHRQRIASGPEEAKESHAASPDPDSADASSPSPKRIPSARSIPASPRQVHIPSLAAVHSPSQPPLANPLVLPPLPVPQSQQQQPQPQQQPQQQREEQPPVAVVPEIDRALLEQDVLVQLLEMGFPEDYARESLKHIDVASPIALQRALNWMEENPLPDEAIKDKHLQQMIDTLISMGFEREKSEQALESCSRDLQRAIVFLLSEQTAQLKKELIREKNAVKQTLTKAQWKDFSQELNRLERANSDPPPFVAVAQDPDREPLSHAYQPAVAALAKFEQLHHRNSLIPEAKPDDLLPVHDEAAAAPRGEQGGEAASQQVGEDHHAPANQPVADENHIVVGQAAAPAVVAAAKSDAAADDDDEKKADEHADDADHADEHEQQASRHHRAQTMPEFADDEDAEDEDEDDDDEKMPGLMHPTSKSESSARKKGKPKYETGTSKRLTSQIVELQEMVLQYQTKYMMLRKKHQRLLSVPKVRNVVDELTMEQGKRPDEDSGDEQEQQE